LKALSQFDGKINLVFTDIDDTLTSEGRLGSLAYNKLWQLQESGVHVVPVTGRPAGWCEMIARMWPVNGVIGENGAFYFQYKNKKMKRVFAISDEERRSHQIKLKAIEAKILHNVTGSALASDQFCRLFDLAIDFCEDVKPLPKESVQTIVSIFKKHGATAKISSIHVNGWFGDYDKKTMCEIFYRDQFARELSENLESCAFIGDSPNDEPLFAFFKNSFAVANIKDFEDQLQFKPQFVCQNLGGEGFAEFADYILKI